MSAIPHRTATREEWLRERIELLAQEKALTRQRDALAARIRALPWVRVEKPYAFETPAGTATLAELFGGRSQLLVYHFMFDPGWPQGCQGCSFLADHYDGIQVHLRQRDLAFITVSRAPLAQIEPFRRRMGWSFPWVSSGDSGFGRDFGVSFTEAELASGRATYNFVDTATGMRELPGLSVFAKDGSGAVHHTYSTFARGLEEFLTAYRFLDLVPKGREEDGPGGMGWGRHHDRYGDPGWTPPWEHASPTSAP